MERKLPSETGSLLQSYGAFINSDNDTMERRLDVAKILIKTSLKDSIKKKLIVIEGVFNRV